MENTVYINHVGIAIHVSCESIKKFRTRLKNKKIKIFEQNI